MFSFYDFNGNFSIIPEGATVLKGVRLALVNDLRKRLYEAGNKKSLERLGHIDSLIKEATEKQASAGTTWDRKKQAQVEKSVCDGLLGCVLEIAYCAKYSRKTWVAKQGKTDIFIKYQATPESPVQYLPCEVKTGNGDINALFDAGAPRFVAYCYILDNSNGRRYCEPQIMLRTQFLKMLEDNDLVTLDRGEASGAKNNQHPTDRLRVKGQSAKLYKWLTEYGLPLNSEAVYTPGDFEEIDLEA